MVNGGLTAEGVKYWGQGIGMMMRLAMVIAAFLAVSPALAQTAMNADTARRFVMGKLFAFTCFDGSRGAGRIYADGSVIASLQMQGSGSVRALWLPAGTLRVRGDTYCANLKGMMFEPCFNLVRLDDRSFRGAVSGLGFAYCDFTRRMTVAGVGARSHGSAPASRAASAAPATEAE
jgi:hypothetical protein